MYYWQLRTSRQLLCNVYGGLVKLKALKQENECVQFSIIDMLSMLATAQYF